MITQYYFSFNQMLIIAIIVFFLGVITVTLTEFLTIKVGNWRYKRAWLLEDEHGNIVEAQHENPYHEGKEDAECL